MNKIDKEQKKRILVLFLLVFEGFGLRIFDGIIPGAVGLWTILIAMLSYKNIRTLPASCWLRFFLFLVVWLGFNILLKNITPPFFLTAAWASAFFVFANYWNGQHSFVEDMELFTKICVYYALLHIPILLLFESSLVVTDLDMNPRTFLYLFWFNGSRVQGFCWEPSCWNLLLNLNLVLSLYLKRGYKQVALTILSILAVMSTTGIVVMAIIIALYFLVSTESKTVRRNIILGSIAVAFIAPYAMEELDNKLETGSGAARYGDFFIAQYIMQEHPFIGADLDAITENTTAIKARDDAWMVEGDYRGYMDQGMTNSFAALFVEWGLPLTLLIFFCMYRSPLLFDRRLRFLFITAILLVIMGTPINRTGFFYLFVFSGFLLNRQQRNALLERTNINNIE